MEGTVRTQTGIALGHKIRAFRKERNWSLEQLSAKSGVALATLSRIENSKGLGTFRTHQRIAEALALPLPDLYRDLEAPDADASMAEELDEALSIHQKTSQRKRAAQRLPRPPGKIRITHPSIFVKSIFTFFTSLLLQDLREGFCRFDSFLFLW